MTATLYITDYGVMLPTGNHPGALLAATLGGQQCARIEDTLMVPTANGAAMPVIAQAPSGQPGLIEQARERLAQWHDQPVLLVLPASDQHQHSRLYGALKPAIGPHVRITSPCQLAEPLEQLAQQLTARDMASPTNSAMVLAVDDLLTQDALLSLHQDGELRTDQQPLGRVPSQGMAWFELRSDDATPDTAPDAVIQWLAHGAGQETNFQYIGVAPLQGLANSIKQCLHGEATPNRPEVVVHARAQTPAEQLEWYHARQRVWPDDRHLPPMELLSPALTHGDLGAASLVAAVVTACERLRFPLKPAQDALVIDTAEHGSRIAVALSLIPTGSSS
ncbi:MAG: hypothetical protein C0462_10725 [Alcanivorax sp.]|nr:hypothetical protein [Alcanivorax sp.]